MSTGAAKKRWDSENTLVVSTKFVRTTEQDMLDFLDSKTDLANGIGRSTVIKQAIRLMMAQEAGEGK